MFKKISFTIKSTHAYWRSVPFAEIAELYAARFFRVIAQNLVDVFVAVFLYQSGYSLLTICLMLAGYYGFRVLLSFLTAYIVSRLGPKTSMLLSNFLAIPAFVALSMITADSFVPLVIYFIFQGASLTVIGVSIDVQFSSIKSDSKAGSELGLFYIVEKIASAVAPVVGGFLAFQFGPKIIMLVASILMVASALPLFITPERARRGQKIIYSGLPWGKVGVQMISPLVRGASLAVTGNLWYVFIALAVFGTASNAVYAQLGVVASISFAASIIVSKIYGTLIDRRKGLQLLRTGVVLSMMVHATRPFVSTPLAVGMVNVANEMAVSAYSMPTIRGQYDMADKLPGYRAVYFSMTMMFFSLGSALLCLVAAGFVALRGEIEGLKLVFWLMAFITPLIMIHGFGSLRAQK